MREQNRNNKRSEIVRFDRFVERKRTCVAFGCWANARLNKLYARELSRNQPILRFNVILQHDWLIEQCLLHIRVFFGGKTKSLCLDLLIHWLIKHNEHKLLRTLTEYFSRSYEDRSMYRRTGFPSAIIRLLKKRWSSLSPLYQVHDFQAWVRHCILATSSACSTSERKANYKL